VRIVLLAVLVCLSGCDAEMHKADNRVLWDAAGCAFVVSPNVGNTSFVRTLPDANKPSCRK